MKFVIAAVWFCLGLAAGAPVLAAAPTLSIVVTGDTARATRLPQYDPRVPVSVAVTDPAANTRGALTLVAAGPAGESLRTPLTRTADGTYAGSLALSDTGTWRVQLESRDGRVRTGTTPISLDVAPPPPSNAWLIGAAVGLGLFTVVGGGGFVLLRRLTRDDPREELQAAA